MAFTWRESAAAAGPGTAAVDLSCERAHVKNPQLFSFARQLDTDSVISVRLLYNGETETVFLVVTSASHRKDY